MRLKATLLKTIKYYKRALFSNAIAFLDLYATVLLYPRERATFESVVCLKSICIKRNYFP